MNSHQKKSRLSSKRLESLTNIGCCGIIVQISIICAQGSHIRSQRLSSIQFRAVGEAFCYTSRGGGCGRQRCISSSTTTDRHFRIVKAVTHGRGCVQIHDFLVDTLHDAHHERIGEDFAILAKSFLRLQLRLILYVEPVALIARKVAYYLAIDGKLLKHVAGRRCWKAEYSYLQLF